VIGRGVTRQRYNVHAFPTTLVIDPNGVAAGSVNVLQHNRLEFLVKQLLEKTPPR